MFPLQQLTLTPIRLNVANQTWQLTPLTLADVGELERAVQLPDRHGVAPSLAQLEQWIHTRAGTAYAFWLALRPHHARLSLSAAQTVVAIAAELPPPGSAALEEVSLPQADTTAPTCWAGLFRYLARRYGWTPQQIAALTIAQAQTLCGVAPAVAGRVLFSRQEYHDWRSKQDAQAAADNSAVEATRKAPCNDAVTEIAKQLAAFRARLPEIYGPLSASTLSRLTTSVPRSNRQQRRPRRSRAAVRPRSTYRAPTSIEPNFQITPQIHWHLHSLMVALRNSAPPSDVVSNFDASSARVARFQ